MIRAEVEEVIGRFHKRARLACSIIALDVTIEVARARSIVAGPTVDVDDLTHLHAYVASRERFYATTTPSPPSSVWSDMAYYQLDHATLLDSYLRECAGALGVECDQKVLHRVVCAFMYHARRTHSIRRFVQHDMYRFAPSDPPAVDVTRRLIAALLNKIEAVETCRECALVVAPPPDAV
jgi:hypothetical protein